jgi:hypothetical protein
MLGHGGRAVPGRAPPKARCRCWPWAENGGMQVTLPDGTTVLAQGRSELVPSQRPREPDFAIYLDERWRDDPQVTWPCRIIGWEDFGLPADEAEIFTAIVDLHPAGAGRGTGRDRLLWRVGPHGDCSGLPDGTRGRRSLGRGGVGPHALPPVGNRNPRPGAAGLPLCSDGEISVDRQPRRRPGSTRPERIFRAAPGQVIGAGLKTPGVG